MKIELTMARRPGNDRVKYRGRSLRQFGRNSCSVWLTRRSNTVTSNSSLMVGISVVGRMGLKLLLRMPTRCTAGVRDDHERCNGGRGVRSVGVLDDHARTHRLLVFLFFSGLKKNIDNFYYVKVPDQF